MTEENLEDNILTKKKFTELVENFVKNNKMSYMEAVVHLAELRDCETTELAKFITGSIRDKIEREAMSLNMIPKTNELPFDD